MLEIVCEGVADTELLSVKTLILLITIGFV